MLEWISMRFWFVLFSTMYFMKFLCTFIRKRKSKLAACWNVIATFGWKNNKKSSHYIIFLGKHWNYHEFSVSVCVCVRLASTKEVRIGRKMHLLNRLTHIIAKEPHNADYYTLLNVSREKDGQRRRTRSFLCLTASYCFNLLPSI